MEDMQNTTTNATLNQLRQLYIDGFKSDSPQFLDYFFDKHIASDGILTHYEDGKLISGGYLVQKPAMLFSRECNLAYLSALATYKEYRGQNKISNIMSMAYSRVKDYAQSFVVLHPFNFLYYKRFGFADISYCANKKIEGGKTFCERQLLHGDIDKVISLYNAATKNCTNKLLLNAEVLAKKLDLFAADNIYGKILSSEGEDFCVAFIENGRAELFFTTDINKANMADNLNNCTYYDYSQPKYPFLQGRIVDAKKALIEYDYDPFIDKSISITVFDKDIKDNCFSAQLVIKDGRAQLKSLVSENIDMVFDISTLTHAMFCGGAGLFKKQINFFCDKF